MILLAIILIILLIPFPYKYSIYYNNQNYYIKFFFIIIKSNNKKKSNKKFMTKNIKPIYKALLWNKFKPKLTIKGNIDYSFSDAMIDAIFYGSLNNLFSFLSIISKYFLSSFNINKLKIKPLYKTNFYFYINVKCILFISFAQIIIIMIYFIYNKILKRW